MVLSLYRLISWLLAAFLPLYLGYRLKKGKELKDRLKERSGIASELHPKGALLWIHAASVGESQSVLPIIKDWVSAYPELSIMLTTVTVTSAELVLGKLPQRVFHQFMPIDTPQATKRFLDYWQPSLICFVDSELWPNMLLEIKQRHIPLTLLNGRISDRSFATWQRFPESAAKLLSAFSFIFAKSGVDAQRFKALGAAHAISYGNMKCSSPPLAVDEQQWQLLKTEIGNRPIWLAASTHEGEESMVADIHTALKPSVPGLLTIIVPRHSARGVALQRELTTKGVMIARRSKGEQVTANTDIFLADTMGELGLFYRLAPIAFIGGSLVPHGGQNPLEAARLHCGIIYGPYMHNFREFTAMLEEADGATKVQNQEELKGLVLHWLQHPERAEAIANAAFEVTQTHKDVMEHIKRELHPLIEHSIQSHENT